MVSEYTFDDYLLQQELDRERMEEWCDSHTCGLCDQFADDGPFEKGWGICLKDSTFFQGAVDCVFVHEDEYHQDCWFD